MKGGKTPHVVLVTDGSCLGIPYLTGSIGGRYPKMNSLVEVRICPNSLICDKYYREGVFPQNADSSGNINYDWEINN